MFSTSCKTLYNVLSYTHGDRVDLYLSGEGEGVTQKRQSLEFRIFRGWHLWKEATHGIAGNYIFVVASLFNSNLCTSTPLPQTKLGRETSVKCHF